MREVTLDTETTGGSARLGDRVIELGMVELIDGRATGRIFHEFMDPRRDVHFGALRVHGLTRQALSGQPVFADLSRAARDFIADSRVLVHNVPFDRGFMNMEFCASGTDPVPDRQWDETMTICRRHFNDGSSVKLDRVVDRLRIETPDRTVHGALLDAAILAAVVNRIRNNPDVDIVDLVSRGNEHRVRRKMVNGWGAGPKPGSDNSAGRMKDTARKQPPAQRSSPPPPPDNGEALSRLNAKPASIDREMYKDLRSGRDEWSSARPENILEAASPSLEGKDELRGAIDGMEDRAKMIALRWICRGMDPEHALCMSVVLDEIYDRETNPETRAFAERLSGLAEPDEGPSP